MDKKKLKIILAAPRGFCAGVDRAVQIVELAIKKYGSPVYVRHEIVHNKFVVDGLRDMGAIFVDELSEIPDDGRPVIFSAHGVPKSVPDEAKSRDIFYIDATCPLVSKVHKEAIRYHEKENKHIILIGHEGHPEVIGTMGQLPKGAVSLVETIDDVNELDIDDDAEIAYCTQTTLSVDDTIDIINHIKSKFKNISEPYKEDICYATTNRQAAVKHIAPLVDMMMVLGAPNSSNSNRLKEVAKIHGAEKSILVQRAKDIDWSVLSDVEVLGITAGASAPEILIDEVIHEARNQFDIELEEIKITDENISFNVPRILRD